MHVWKKHEGAPVRRMLHCLLLMWLCLQLLTAAADTPGILVEEVVGNMAENTYMISARIDYRLGTEAEKALVHGIPLQFDIAIAVKQHRRWLWDKSITSVRLKYKLQFHPLGGYYLLTNMDNGDYHQFKTIAGIRDTLGRLKNYPLLARAALEPGGDYYGVISVNLDRKSLPAPLRPLAYISSQWQLASPTFAWSIHP